jgi:hypothetical protein
VPQAKRPKATAAERKILTDWVDKHGPFLTEDQQRGLCDATHLMPQQVAKWCVSAMACSNHKGYARHIGPQSPLPPPPPGHLTARYSRGQVRQLAAKALESARGDEAGGVGGGVGGGW